VHSRHSRPATRARVSSALRHAIPAPTPVRTPPLLWLTPHAARLALSDGSTGQRSWCARKPADCDRSASHPCAPEGREVG
jgi:hypothetical protein